VGKLWVVSVSRHPLWALAVVLLVGCASSTTDTQPETGPVRQDSSTELSGGIPLRSFGVYLNSESGLVVAVANDVLAIDNKYPESSIGFFAMTGEIAQEVPAKCRGEIVASSTNIDRSFTVQLRLDNPATKEFVTRSQFADWQQGLIRFVDCGLLDGEHPATVSTLPKASTSFSDRQDGSVWSILPLFPIFDLGMNPALPIRLPAQLMLAKSGAQSDLSWMKSTNTDPILVANDVLYDESYVGYVGQTKSSRWLAIRAGLDVSGTTPVVAVEDSSKDACEVEGEILTLLKVGECLVQVSASGSTAGLRLSIAKQLPRTTVDRPGGNILDIKPLYITFKNGPDEHHDTDGLVARMVLNSLDFLAEQNPGFTPRLDTFNNLPDIQHVQLPITLEQFLADWNTTFGPLPKYLKQAGLNINLDAQPKPLGSLSNYDKTNRIYVGIVEGPTGLKEGFDKGHSIPGCGFNANPGLIMWYSRDVSNKPCTEQLPRFDYKGSMDANWDPNIVSNLVAPEQMRSHVGCDKQFNSYFGLPLERSDNSVLPLSDPIYYKYRGSPSLPWVMDANHDTYFKITQGNRKDNICFDLAYSSFWSPIKNSDSQVDSENVRSSRLYDNMKDESTLPMVKAFYVLAKDSVDDRLDIDGTIAKQIDTANDWLFANGGKRIRFDTYLGKTEVNFIRLDQTEAELWMDPKLSNTKCKDSPCPELPIFYDALMKRGLLPAPKLAAIFYGGQPTPASRIVRPACSTSGPTPATLDRLVRLNMFTGKRECGDPTIFATTPTTGNTIGLSTFHEIFHLVGAVGNSPHSDTRMKAGECIGSGHINDNDSDFMASSKGVVLLDPGNDDYWGHGKTSYVDASLSAYMDPQAPNAQMPPCR